jgi:ABC-type dipeptide/oligopeptide/nickel transport system permease component
MEKAPKAGRFGAFARTRRGRIGLILCPLLVLVIVAIALGVTFGVRAHQDHASELSSITITLVSSAPSNASALDSALMGFSIEGDRWTDWAGINETNQLFANALGNLRNKTGAAPWIRIGADSEGQPNSSMHKKQRLNQ